MTTPATPRTAVNQPHYRSTSRLRQKEATPIEFYQTLDLINSFTIQTISLLNHFSLQCETKLNRVEHDLHRVEITLSLLESKLKSVDGMESKMKEFESSSTTVSNPTITTTMETTTTNSSGVPPPPSSASGFVPPPPGSSGFVPPPPGSAGFVPPPPSSAGFVPPPPSMSSSGSMGIPPPPVMMMSGMVPPLPLATTNNYSTATSPVESEAHNDDAGNVLGENMYTCETDPRLARYFRLFYKVGAPRQQLEMDIKRDLGLTDSSFLDTPTAPSPLGPYIPPPAESESEEEEEEEEDN